MEIIINLEDLFQKSHFKKGLEQIRSISNLNDLSIDELVQIKILELRFLEKTENYSKALKIVENLLKNPAIATDQARRMAILIEKSKIFFSCANLDSVKKIIKKVERMLVAEDNFEIPKFQRIAADLALLKGGYYWQLGELEEALYHFRLSYKIRRILRNPLDIAHALNNLGVLYNAMGKFNDAIKYLKKSYDRYEEINYKRGISKTGNNLGAIYLQLGELNKCEVFIQNSLKIDIKGNYMDGIIVGCQNLGEVYWHKMNYSQAIFYFQQSLNLSERKQNQLQVSEVLVPYITVLIEIKESDKAQKLFDRLTEIKENMDNNLVDQRYLLCQALLIRTTDNWDSLERATKLLSTIVDDKVRYFDLTVMAISNLCDILLYQAGITQNPSLLLEIEKRLEYLINFASQSHSYFILAKVFWLNAELLTYYLKFEAAQDNLIKALHIVEKYELKQLEEKIIYEYDSFLKNWSFWKQSSEKNYFSFKTRQINRLKLQMKSLFLSDLSSLEKENEENPIVFMLHQKNGKQIVKFGFDSRWENETLFYRAFEISFYEEFRNYLQKGINITQIGRYKIHFVQLNNFIVSYIYTGSSYFAYQKMSKFNTLITQQKDTFVKWSKELEKELSEPKINSILTLQLNKDFLSVFSIFANV